RRSLRAHLRVPQEQLAPLRALAPSLERPSVEHRPPIEIVIDLARQDEPVDERRVEEQLLESFERTEPNQITARQAYEILAHMKLPVFARGICIPDHLDVCWSTDAEAILVREPDVIERHRIEPHEPCRNRVDRDLVG